MKNILYIIAAIAVIGLVVFLVQSNGKDTKYAMDEIMYTTTSGETIAVRDSVDGEMVKLTTPTHDKVELARAISASGERYANADETLEFWCKGTDCTVFENGEVVYETEGTTAGEVIELSGTSWRYTAASLIDAWVEVTEGVEITLNFADGQVDGDAGCNGFFGEYTQDGDSVSFGPLGTTRMLCEDDVMFEEDNFLQNLGQVDSFYFEGTQLTLNYGDGTALIFIRENTSPENDAPTDNDEQIIDHGGLHTYETCIGTPDAVQLGAPDNKQCAIGGSVYFESGQPAIPLLQCTSYYDGCNTSIINDGEVGGTTLMACEVEIDVPSCFVGEQAWNTGVGEIVAMGTNTIDIVFGDIVESFTHDDLSLAGMKVGDTVRVEYLSSADYTEKTLTAINEY